MFGQINPDKFSQGVSSGEENLRDWEGVLLGVLSGQVFTGGKKQACQQAAELKCNNGALECHRSNSLSFKNSPSSIITRVQKNYYSIVNGSDPMCIPVLGTNISLLLHIIPHPGCQQSDNQTISNLKGRQFCKKNSETHGHSTHQITFGFIEFVAMKSWHVQAVHQQGGSEAEGSQRQLESWAEGDVTGKGVPVTTAMAAKPNVLHKLWWLAWSSIPLCAGGSNRKDP